MKLALAADRVFTARSDAAEFGVVVIDGGRIVGVESAAPPGVSLVELRGATLLPGLIDAHTHLSIMPSRGNQIEQMKQPVAEQLATARSNVFTDLLSGVTTLRVMGQEMDVDFLLRDEIARGETMGPELVCAGVQLAKPGGHGHALTAVTSETEIVQLIDRNAARGAGLIKIFTTGGVSSVATSSGDCPFTPREVRCAADAAHRHGLKLASHAHGGAGARIALENGVDTIEHAVLFDDELIVEAARRQVSIVGTFSILDHPAGSKPVMPGDRRSSARCARAAHVWRPRGAASCRRGFRSPLAPIACTAVSPSTSPGWSIWARRPRERCARRRSMGRACADSMIAARSRRACVPIWSPC